MASNGEASDTAREYLETIYNISMEGDRVVGAQLAEKFGVSPPSVTGMLHRLERDGYLIVDRKRGAMLTPHGVEVAELSLRRHRLAERFLVDVLGMDWIAAHEEAQALQIGMTPRLEAHMLAVLDNPTTCPHGNPIPGSELDGREFLRSRHAVRLSDVNQGQAVRVVCVSEVVEDEGALIREVGHLGLHPGRELRVSRQGPSGTTIDLDGEQTAVVKSLADKIWVAADSS
ncbi:MAG TPA: metal-dependent transcriptional regulator [Chloroflexota bacterium]|nr:metal-dependent transcriptional regulator [Chloroflexota bacterium]